MSTVEQDYMIVRDSNSATVGAGTFWALSGDVSLSSLAQAWSNTALPEAWLLSTPSDAVALRRAIKSMETADVFMESVKTTGEIALVRKSELDGLPVYVPLAKWRLNKVMQPEQTFAKDDEAKALDAVVQARFLVELDTINSNDVSIWLRTLVETRFNGICLRETGGFYYVPPATLPLWQEVKQAMSAATGHRIYNLPMVKSDEAVETILAACMAESEKVIADLTETLEQNVNGTGPLRSKALETQANKADDLKRRMAAYGQFLGVTMVQIEEKLSALKSGLFMASAMAANNK